MWLSIIVIILDGDVAIFERYLLKAIPGFNNYEVSGSNSASIRNCYEQCVTAYVSISSSVTYSNS